MNKWTELALKLTPLLGKQVLITSRTPELNTDGTKNWNVPQRSLGNGIGKVIKIYPDLPSGEYGNMDVASVNLVTEHNGGFTIRDEDVEGLSITVFDN